MRDDLDAATLRDLADVSRGDAAMATRAALYQLGQGALIAFVYGDIDADAFIEAMEDVINDVALLADPERDD